MLQSLLLAAVVSASPVVAAETPVVHGFDAWRFGMSREEVTAVEDAGPYSEVSATGGLETRAGQFAGKETTISFVFGPRGLYHIQIWAYQGSDPDAAMAAFERTYHYLVRELGPVHSDGQRWPTDLSSEALRERIPGSFFRNDAMTTEELRRRGSVQAQVEKLHLHPVTDLGKAEVYASLLHSENLGLYWVFVYYRAPDLAP